MIRSRIEWGALLAIEPTIEEVAANAAALAMAYNDPHNAPLMGHVATLTPDEVIEHYASMIEGGGAPFLLFEDGAFAGDADLRGISNRAAEFAFLVATPSAQGKGLGTRFATMVHAFAFAQRPIDHLYASVIPGNLASRRVFEKLGYVLDGSLPARAYADEPSDIVMSIGRATFLSRCAADMAHIIIAVR